MSGIGVQVVVQLLRLNAATEETSDFDGIQGATALMLACKWNRLDAAWVLVEHGAFYEPPSQVPRCALANCRARH
jgi:hypothetical protein